MLNFINRDKKVILIEHDNGEIEILDEEMKQQHKEKQDPTNE